ncbi:terpene synthase family protein [Streptomyces daliensis]
MELPVPPVLCPFPFSYDEEAARRADEGILAWAGSLGLPPERRTELAGHRIGTFAAMTHPDAADDDHLSLAARNMYAMFVADDHYCDEGPAGASSTLCPARLGRTLTALEGPRLSDSAAAEELVGPDLATRALREVARHMTRLGTPAQAGRLRHETSATFLAMAGESSWRLARHLPGPREYLAHRQYNGALSCLALIDVTGGYELPARDWENPAVRSLTLTASLLIILVNDLYSVAKESADIGSQSLPTLLSAHHGWPLDRSMRITGELHDHLMCHYLRREAQLTADTANTADVSPEQPRYLRGLRNWMRGSLQWHASTGRHHRRAGRPTPATDSQGPAHDRLRTALRLRPPPGLCPHCRDGRSAP